MFGFELFEAVAPFLNAGPGFPTFSLSRGAPAGAKSTGVSRGPAAGSRFYPQLQVGTQEAEAAFNNYIEEDPSSFDWAIKEWVKADWKHGFDRTFLIAYSSHVFDL